MKNENGQGIYTVYNESAYPIEDAVLLPNGEYVDLDNKKYVGTKVSADAVRFEMQLKPKETVVFIKRS